MELTKPLERTCIINGNIFNYDYCGETFETYNNLPVKEHLIYLGYGLIDTIGGKKQTFLCELHFWQIIKTKREYGN